MSSVDPIASRNALLEALQWGTASNFPLKCMHYDFPPINNTSVGPGNIIEWEINQQDGTFLDPQNTYAAFRFYLSSATTGAATATYAFDYNTKALINVLLILMVFNFITFKKLTDLQ